MATINMHDAKTQLSDLVARAEAGEEIVIARRNKPAVRLVPVTPPDKSAQWNEMEKMAGFAEDKQAEFDMSGLREAVEARREFTIMRDGKAVATVVPAGENPKRVQGFGMLAHLPPVPDELFFDPLPEEELRAWEGGQSFDPDRFKP